MVGHRGMSKRLGWLRSFIIGATMRLPIKPLKSSYLFVASLKSFFPLVTELTVKVFDYFE